MYEAHVYRKTYPILIPEKLVCGFSTPLELLLNIPAVTSFPDLFDLFDFCDILPDDLVPVTLLLDATTTSSPAVVGVATPTMSGATEDGFKTMNSSFPLTLYA